MSDTGTAGDRIDAALAQAKQALNELRTELAAKAAEVGVEITAKIEQVSAAIDEIQAAWAERQADTDTAEPEQA